MDVVSENKELDSIERSKIIEEEVESLDVRDLDGLKNWMDKNIVRFPEDIDDKDFTREEKIDALHQEFADIVNQNPPTDERPTAKYFEGPIKFNLKYFAEPKPATKT